MSHYVTSLKVLGAGILWLVGGGCADATAVTAVAGGPHSSTGVTAAPAGVPVYDVTPINAITGLRVNQSGDVVGWTTANGIAEPILYAPETGVIVLPTSTAQPYGVARDLTDRLSGVITVVGEARLNPTGTAIHAVRWRVAIPSGTVTGPTDLGVLPGATESIAYGVNGAGQVVGMSTPSSSLSIRSFIYSPTTGMVDLGLGGVGQNAWALDVNASGVVTGYLGLTAFRWTASGGLQSLGAPAGYPNSFGYAINANGQVAGSAGTASGNAQRVVRYTDGRGWEILGGGGQTNAGKGINLWGDVVGTGAPQSPILLGVIYTDPLGFLAHIDDLLLTLGSWRVLDAYDINDAQQITGWAINGQTGLRTAVLLTPVNPPPPNLPPVADFSYSCNALLYCGFDGSSSTDDRGVLNWVWTRNGQAIGTGKFVGVQFSAPQTVNVTLTVTDSRGATNSVTRPVVVGGGGANQPPVARYTVTCSPGKCVFDASSSTDDQGIVSYAWTPSASNRPAATGVSITRKWLAAGGNNYQETLTVTDGGGLTNSVTQAISIPPPSSNQPPVARFTVTCVPGSCTLDASSSTDDRGIVSYSWTAAGRPTKTGVVITRKWLSGGSNTYQETMTVTDGGGLTSSATHTVTIPPN